MLDLDKYVPGLLTLIASNLSGGASTAYLSLYAAGIETWRVMVMLALEGRVTAQRMVQLLDADKGAISRTFKTMHAQGLLRFEPDAKDGRVRHATFTPEGRSLHDRIIRLALVREQAALAVLSDAEVDTLREVLRRIYLNLPEVERASAEFIRSERESLGLAPDGPPLRRRGGAASPDAPAVARAARSKPSSPPAQKTRAPRR
ncbi:MAG TPA: MarR family transcriptional regulator [Ramlibacter sp.]|nr:MarR family transcriptional regulator [Ramlibacter sp.]